MAMENKKRSVAELNALETSLVVHAMTEADCAFVKTIFKIAKVANVNEHELMAMAAHSINRSADDPVFWEKIAPDVIAEINAEDEDDEE